jgi:hypothetical protein
VPDVPRAARSPAGCLSFKRAGWKRAVSYSLAKGKWEVRWRDGDGRQRSRTFDDEAPARAFDDAIHDQTVKERKPTSYGESGGVYLYETAQGTRWRCKVKAVRAGGLPAGVSGTYPLHAASLKARSLTNRRSGIRLRSRRRTTFTPMS